MGDQVQKEEVQFVTFPLCFFVFFGALWAIVCVLKMFFSIFVPFGWQLAILAGLLLGLGLVMAEYEEEKRKANQFNLYRKRSES